MGDAAESSCVACGGALRARPYFSGTAFVLYQCAACGSLTALPRATSSQQRTRHDTDDYFAHPYFEDRREMSTVLENRCRLTFNAIGRALDVSSLKGETHLDVGCDTGTFLRAAARLYGTIPCGVDVAQRSVAEAKGAGTPAFCGTIHELPSHVSNLALVTAIDVIEHVTDPVGLLAEIRERLRPGGICFIETPNAASLLYRSGHFAARLTGNRPVRIFDCLFPIEHVQYFSLDGIRLAAMRAGLEVVEGSSRRLPGSEHPRRPSPSASRLQ